MHRSPGLEAIEPEPQVLQVPPAKEEVPAAQFTHAVRAALLVVPAAQLVQVAVPGLGAILPEPQLVHVPPAEENVPMGQSRH